MGQLFCIFVTVKAPTAKHRRRRSLKRVPFVPLRSPAPTPIDYNIMDNESGLCLWVNTNRRTLMDGAFDVYDPSAEFCINLYNPNDSTTFWIQSLAFSSVTALAVDFSLYPIQIVMVKSCLSHTCMHNTTILSFGALLRPVIIFLIISLPYFSL